MTTKLFFVLLFLPSIVLAMTVLATFYGTARAYLAVAWVPLAFYIALRALQALLTFGHADDRAIEQLLEVVAWTSLVQAALGAVLFVGACVRRENRLLLLAAACAACAPFLIYVSEAG